jgi:hypothetical protein
MLFIPENIKQLKEQIIFQNDFYFKKTKMQLCSTKNNVLLYCLKVWNYIFIRSVSKL